MFSFSIMYEPFLLNGSMHRAYTPTILKLKKIYKKGVFAISARENTLGQFAKFENRNGFVYSLPARSGLALAWRFLVVCFYG